MLLFFLLIFVYGSLSSPLFPYLIFPKLSRKPIPFLNLRFSFENTICTFLLFVVQAVVIYQCVYYTYEYDIWYRYLLPIIVPLVFHLIYAIVYLKKICVPYVVAAISLLILLWSVVPIRDIALQYKPELEIVVNKADIDVETSKPFIQDKDILYERFRINYSKDKFYDKDGHSYIYYVDTDSGSSLIINAATYAKKIPLKYDNNTYFDTDNNTKIIRNLYPKNQVIHSKHIFKSEGEFYEEFLVLERKRFFERPIIQKKVLLNLVTGEIL
ncbi:MAG: hypothetical protein N2749_03800 [Clostridia bacterium]|nr:hypothetical protein [Clostridia bacterium]